MSEAAEKAALACAAIFAVFPPDKAREIAAAIIETAIQLERQWPTTSAPAPLS